MPYINHRNFDQFKNPSEVVVWRYLRLGTLLKMLSNQSMRFTKITEWKDLLEGHVEPFTQDSLKDDLGVSECPQYIVDAINKLRTEAKHKLFANCWCVYDEEINLMWDSYGNSDQNDVGIAIKTTADILYSSIVDSRDVYSAVVTYEKFPYTPKSGNVFIDSVIKSTSYSFENELRLLYMGEESDSNGDVIEKFISINTDNLMKHIIINPYATDEDYDYVYEKISSANNGSTFNLERSSIRCKKRDYKIQNENK